METIYWIQRLGLINTLGWIFFAIALLAMIVFGFVAASHYADKDYYNDDMKQYKLGVKGFKTSMCIFLISMCVGLFVPSENDLYAIYGIGGTIDYIKSNDTAKRLPDKVINALDAWIDKQTENNKDK